MKFVFVQPPGELFWKAMHRYSILQRTLHQRYNMDSVIVEGSVFRGKTSDTGMLCSDADVIILHIQACKDSAQMIQHWKARDKIVIIDISVPILLDPVSNLNIFSQSSVTRAGQLVYPASSIARDELIWMIKLADGVIVNSRQMQEDWSGYGRVFYIPDYLDMDQYLIHPYEAHEGTNIGIHVSDGGFQKIVDTGLLTAIEVVGARFPHTNMFFYGVQPERMADIRLLSHQKLIIPSEKTNRWMEVLPSLDVGILPKYSGFDQREGRESILEFMMMKVPWAASSGICCRDLGQYGWLVQNNPATWERILDDMLTNLENYRAESAEGYIFALGQGIDENIDKLLAVCYSIKSDVFTGVV